MTDTRSIALHIRLTEEQRAAVQALAEKEDRKMAAMLALLVKEALAARAANSLDQAHTRALCHPA